ncbi:hypothetical protein [Cellulomonas triticagri]|uniref:Uncharacterized protein n=1 Tax=Cellulomonas triticagri TaxID=2483352 RepID=A0A3M2JQ48_9CELL|nr:hypothetical protein [Cellulomonas triticagri]RMI13940.1 hypothetical protein EBM89_02250 [Cellulomonas triticagri]
MSTTDQAPARPTPGRLLLAGAVVAVVAATLVLTAIALDRWGPGNIGRGFAVGAVVGSALAGFAIWRALRRPDRATSGDRLFVGRGDERDRAVAARTFALLGAWALPLTMAAFLAMALGAPADASMGMLFIAQVAVGLVAAWRAAQRL